MSEAVAAEGRTLVEAARALVPRVRAGAEQIEQERRLPDELVAALAEAGVFRMLVPRAIGGGEVDPITQLEAIEALSYADGSTGWVAAIGSGTAWATALLRPEVGYELVGRDPRALMVGSFAAAWNGRALAVEGGYRVTGRWPFASGCQHARWLVGHSTVYDGDSPRLRPDGTPATRVMIFPVAECTILDTWSVSGLRGTGSHDFEVADLLVPTERTLTFQGEPPYHSGPLYVARFFLLAHAAHALGIARAAIEALVELANGKRQPGKPALLRERGWIQAQVAEAEVLARSARAFAWQTAQDAWDEASAGGSVSLERWAVARLATSAAVTSAARAVDLMYTAGGGSSLYTRSPLQRHFRDVHAATQHGSVAQSTVESVGLLLLERAAGEPYSGPSLL